MKQALYEAKRAGKAGDVPVGAVLVRGDQLLASSGNRKQRDADPSSHAELLTIRYATRQQGHWFLDDCTLYSTLELCAMCYGAAIQSRVGRIVYGAPEPKFGAMGSRVDLSLASFNHKPEIVSGVMVEESASLLRAFFRKQRKNSE